MKNLYAITFEHLSQKDSEKWIKSYFIGTPDEIWKEIDEHYLCLEDMEWEIWKDEDENWNDVYMTLEEIQKLARESIENSQEEFPTIADEGSETIYNYNDLYYWKTFYWYKLMKQNISEDEIQTLKNLKIIN